MYIHIHSQIYISQVESRPSEDKMLSMVGAIELQFRRQLGENVVCIYMYVFMYISLCLNIHMYIDFYCKQLISRYTYEYTYTHIFIHIYKYICIHCVGGTQVVSWTSIEINSTKS